MASAFDWLFEGLCVFSGFSEPCAVLWLLRVAASSAASVYGPLFDAVAVRISEKVSSCIRCFRRGAAGGVIASYSDRKRRFWLCSAVFGGYDNFVERVMGTLCHVGLDSGL